MMLRLLDAHEPGLLIGAVDEQAVPGARPMSELTIRAL
jgi:hypothetical protein